jgi:hypothetical protein
LTLIRATVACCSKNVSHRISVPSGSAGRSAREPPSGAAFGVERFECYLAHQETFQNWRGSKVITTRRFRPRFQDEKPDVPEPVAFSSLRTTQQTRTSREDLCPNAGVENRMVTGCAYPKFSLAVFRSSQGVLYLAIRIWILR